MNSLQGFRVKAVGANGIYRDPDCPPFTEVVSAPSPSLTGADAPFASEDFLPPPDGGPPLPGILVPGGGPPLEGERPVGGANVRE